RTASRTHTALKRYAGSDRYPASPASSPASTSTLASVPPSCGGRHSDWHDEYTHLTRSVMTARGEAVTLPTADVHASGSFCCAKQARNAAAAGPHPQSLSQAETPLPHLTVTQLAHAPGGSTDSMDVGTHTTVASGAASVSPVVDASAVVDVSAA